MTFFFFAYDKSCGLSVFPPFFNSITYSSLLSLNWPGLGITLGGAWVVTQETIRFSFQETQ